MNLELVSHLGGHLDGTAERLAEMLGERLGLTIRFDPTRPWGQRRQMIERGSPELVWMCGYLTRRLTDRAGTELDIVAAPIFADQSAPVYHSVVVVREDSTYGRLSDLEGARLVINEEESWSGHHALGVHLADDGKAAPFFASAFESGSHAASLEAVLKEEADCASIDCTLWTLQRGQLGRRLRAITRTRDWPAPPVSVARRLDPGLRRDIREALITVRDLDANLEAVVPATSRAYDEMAQHQPVAI